MAAGDSRQFSVVPAVGDPVPAANTLALLDQLADPDVAEPQAPEPTPIGRTYAFDFALGQLIPSAAGAPVMLYGIESLKAWIEKCLKTDRAAAPVHVASDYGLEGANEEIDGSAFDPSVFASMEDRVRDALTQHPRISDVTDWNVEYDDGSVTGNPPDDAVYLSFTVIPYGDDLDPLAVARYPLIAPGPAQVG